MKSIPKLLFIDDDPLFLGAYKDFFTKQGFEIEIADNGLKAIGKLESMEKLPNLIVLDALMPEMNGFEILKILKNNPRYKRIPVIMLTNLDNSDQVQQAFNTGAILYLVKSNYGPKEVVEKIKEIVSAYKSDISIPEVTVKVKALGKDK